MTVEQVRDRISRLTSQSFNRLVVLAVVLGFGAVMIAAISVIWSAIRDQELTRWVAHSTLVQAEVSQLRISLEQAEAARRGYLITRDPAGKETFEQSVADAPVRVDRLIALTKDNADQVRRLEALREAIKGHTASARGTVDLVANGAQAEAMHAFQTDRASASMRELRARIDDIRRVEAALLREREAAQAESVHNLYLSLGVAGPLLALVAFGSTWAILRYTHDLNRTGAALRQLNEGLEHAVSERTASLARANDEIQRFAYIVSHDLRSPLVNIMGFTAELETALKPLEAQVKRLEAEAPQLLSAEAATTVREDVPEALGFIRKSTQKMDRLINAILQLSRSGRRQLKPERLDLTQVLSDVAATLKARADEAGAEIVIAPDLPAVISDRTALEQIFANLMENAVKYLKPGRPGRIVVSGEHSPGHVAIAISDNGRGIDPRDHERIFELFRRSGAQTVAGEGIGLAAVRATVHRIGGSIVCESALDEGATFRVLLPAILRSEPEPAA